MAYLVAARRSLGSMAFYVGEYQTAVDHMHWVIAALNSIEMVSVPWWFLKVSGDEHNGLTSWMKKRLDQLGSVLGEREWLAASRFTVADILMADVLRVPDVRAFAASPGRVTSSAMLRTVSG